MHLNFTLKINLNGLYEPRKNLNRTKIKIYKYPNGAEIFELKNRIGLNHPNVNPNRKVLRKSPYSYQEYYVFNLLVFNSNEF